MQAAVCKTLPFATSTANKFLISNVLLSYSKVVLYKMFQNPFK